MTTHRPYGPTPPDVGGGYPTAPPWAPAARPPAPPTTTSYLPHGRLMVAYPDAMHDAVRPDAPAWWPVVALTALFGPLGAVTAARRGRRARLLRRERYPYWVAHLLTLALVTAPGYYWLGSLLR